MARISGLTLKEWSLRKQYTALNVTVFQRNHHVCSISISRRFTTPRYLNSVTLSTALSIITTWSGVSLWDTLKSIIISFVFFTFNTSSNHNTILLICSRYILSSSFSITNEGSVIRKFNKRAGRMSRANVRYINGKKEWSQNSPLRSTRIRRN